MHTNIPTLAHMRSVLDNQAAAQDMSALTGAEKLRWISRVLSQLHYESLSREEKGTVRQYIARATAYSLPHIERQIALYRHAQQHPVASTVLSAPMPRHTTPVLAGVAVLIALFFLPYGRDLTSSLIATFTQTNTVAVRSSSSSAGRVAAAQSSSSRIVVAQVAASSSSRSSVVSSAASSRSSAASSRSSSSVSSRRLVQAASSVPFIPEPTWFGWPVLKSATSTAQTQNEFNLRIAALKLPNGGKNGQILMIENGKAVWKDFPGVYQPGRGIAPLPSGGGVAERPSRGGGGGGGGSTETTLVQSGLDQNGADARFVNVTGDTMTGLLNILVDGLALNVSGTISGSTIHASSLLSTSGNLLVAGSAVVRGNLSGATLTVSALKNCNSIDTDASGNFVCGTDEGGVGSTYKAGQGLTLNTITSTFSLNSTITGALASYQTLSGRTVTAGTRLTSSGILSIEGNAYFQSGVRLTALTNCDSLDTDANGDLVCGTDADTNTTYTAGQGIVLNGTTFRLGSTLTGSVLSFQTVSGSTLFANSVLRSSGSLAVEGNTFLQGGLKLASGGFNGCGMLTTDPDGDLVCSSAPVDTNTRYAAGQGITLTGTGFSLNTNITGATLEFGSVSGTTVFANNRLSSSGVLAVDGATFLQGSVRITSLTNCNTLDTNSNGDLVCGTDEGTTYTAGQGIVLNSTTFRLSTTLTGSLASFQTVSGSTLFAQNSLRSSGSLVIQGNGLVKGNLTTRGNLSGATLTVSSLKNCDTLDTDGNGNLICGTDGGSAYVAGQGVTLNGNVFRLNGILTGSLVSFQTISGSTIAAANRLSSSGVLAVEGNSFLQGTVAVTGNTTLSSGLKLASGGFNNCTALSTDSDGDVVCDTDDNTTYTAAQGLTLNGTSFRLNATITGSLLEFTTVSGATVHAQDTLQSSGALAIDGTAYFNSGLRLASGGFNSCGALTTDSSGNLVCSSAVVDTNTRYAAGQGLTLTGTGFSLNTNITGSTLEFASVSGASVSATNRLSSSGVLAVDGNTYLNSGLKLASGGFNGCTALETDADGDVVCGTDDDTNTTYSAGQGLSLNGTTFRLNATVTGSLLKFETISGSTLFAKTSLASSGTLVVQSTGLVKGNLTTRGNLSGATITVSSLRNCNTIDTDASGNFVCGVDETAASGLDIGTADTRYVNISGDTMTGALAIRNGNGTVVVDNGVLLEVLGTASGRVFHAQDELRSSGTLLVEGNSVLQSGLKLASGGFNGCTALATDADGDVICDTDDNTTYSVGRGLTLNGTVITLNTTLTGSLLNFQTVSGSTIAAANRLTSSGVLAVEGNSFLQGTVAVTGNTTLSSGLKLASGGFNNCTALSTDADGDVVCDTDDNTTYTAAQGLTLNGTSFRLNATITGSLLEFTTVSGATVHAQDQLRSSGTLLVEGNSILQSGLRLASGGFNSCTSLETDSSGNITCGTDADTTYNVGRGLTLNGTTITLNTTITGSLVNFTTVSGSTVAAANRLTSSGVLAVDGNTFLQGGLKLASGGFNACGMLTTDADGDLVCSTAVVDTNTRYAAGQGITLTGTGFSLSLNITGSTLEFASVSGATVSATNRLTSSGVLAVDGNTFLQGGLKLASGGFNGCTALETDADGDLVCGSDSDTTYVAGQGVTLNGNVFRLNGILTGSLVSFQTVSGTTIAAANRLSSSGVLAVEGNSFLQGTVAVTGNTTLSSGLKLASGGFNNCTALSTDADGDVVCDTDDNTTYTAAQGLTLNGTSFRLNATITGSLVEFITVSGATVSATDRLTSSGVLAVDGNAFLQGTVRLTALTNCNTLDTNSNGDLVCGTDADTNTQYSAAQGLTLTGTGFRLSANITGSTLEFALVSGATVHAQNTLQSSGALAIDGTAYLNSGLRLASGGFNGCTALATDSSGNVTCDTDDNTTYSVGRGLTLNGTVITLNTTLTGSVVNFQTVSGSLVSAANRLTSSGVLAVDGNAFLQGGLRLASGGFNSCTALSTNSSGDIVCDTDDNTTYTAAQGLTLNGTSFRLNATITGSLLEFVTVSGATVHAQDQLRSSGTLLVEGNSILQSGLRLASGGFNSCTALSTDSSGNITCDTDDNTTYTAAQGLTLNGTSFRLNATITGSLVRFQTVSGSQVFAANYLRSSGALVVENNSILKGNLSVSGTLAVMQNTYLQNGLKLSSGGFNNCSTLETDADGDVVCGTDDNTTYAAGRGLGLTGNVFTLNTTITGSLLEFSTVSGATVSATNRLTSSGILAVEGNSFLQGTVAVTGNTTLSSGLKLASGGFNNCTALSTDADGDVVCDTDDNTTYTAAQGLTLNGTSFRLNATITGSLLEFTTVSGATVSATNRLTSSGVLAVDGNTFLQGGLRLASGGFNNCGVLTTDSSGNLVCSAATSVGKSYSAGQGLTLTGTGFKLNSTITGSLVRFQTVSGSTVTAKSRLTSSGTLSVEGETYLQGQVSVVSDNDVAMTIYNSDATTALVLDMAADDPATYVLDVRYDGITELGVDGDGRIYGDGFFAGDDMLQANSGIRIVSGFNNCGVLTTDSSGNLVCSAATSVGKSYSAGQGLTLTGTGFRLSSTISGSLLKFTTVSGSTLFARSQLLSSGSLSVEGQTYLQSGLRLTSGGFNNCGRLTTDSSGNLVCSSNTAGTQYAAGQGLTLTGTGFRLSSTITGSLLEFTTVSGATVHAQDQLRSSGSLIVEGSANIDGTTLIVDSTNDVVGIGATNSNFAMSITAPTNKSGLEIITTTAGYLGLDVYSTLGSGVRIYGGTNASDYGLIVMNGAGTSPMLRVGGDGNISMGAFSADTKLEVIGTASGRILHAQDILRSSGSLLVDGAVYLNNYANCTALETSNGQIVCGTDDTGSISVGQGLRTLNGALALNTTISGSLLEFTTVSGATVFARNSLLSSGALVVKKYAGTSTGNILVIDTAGFVYDASNKRVGVGIAEPAAPVQIHSSSITTPARLLLTNAWTGTASTDGSFLEVNGTSLSIGNQEAAPIYFYRGSEIKMQVDSSGNITMGDNLFGDVANAKLEVIGTASGRILHAQDILRSSGTLLVEGDTYLDGSTLYVDSADNYVGIGTTNPFAQLHLYNGSASTDIVVESDTSNAFVYLDSGANGYAGFTLKEAGTNKWTIANHGSASDTLVISADGGIGSEDFFSIAQTGNVAIGAALAGDAKLEIIGTASGRILHAQDILRSSGSLIVDGNAYFNGLINTSFVPSQNATYDLGNSSNRWNNLFANVGNFSGNITAASGNFSGHVTPSLNVTYDLGASSLRWNVLYANTGNFSGNLFANGNVALGDGAADNVSFNGLVNTSILLAANNSYNLANTSNRLADIFSVNGNFSQNVTAGFVNIGNTSIDSNVRLEIIGMASGRVLHAQDRLASSGTLVVQSGVTFKSLTNCSALQTDSAGALSCGSAGGLSQTTADSRYVNVSGDTMTGGLIIRSGNGTAFLDSGILFEVLGVASGRILHAQDILRSSGSLIVDGSAYFNGNVSTNFIPASNATYDLGNTSLRWNNLYANTGNFSGNVNMNGNVGLGDATSDNIAANGLFNTSLLPAANVTYDLGNTSNRWNGLYAGTGNFSGNLFANGNVSLGDAAGDNISFNGSANTSILAAANNSYALGNSTNRWSNIFSVDGNFSNNISVNNLYANTNVSARNTLSGGALTIMSGNSSFLGPLNLGSTAIDTNVKLEIIGMASGRVLHAQDILRSSGSLIADGLVYFNNYANCTALETVNGLLTCGTDAEGSGGGSASGNVVPSRATMWHDESKVITGGSLSQDSSNVGSQAYQQAMFQSTCTNSDSFTNGFLLKAGTYTFSVLGIPSSNRGIIDWYIDGVLAVSQQDWYAAAANFNTPKTASVTVSSSGYHVLKGVVNGKNASASSYCMVLTKMWFSPATDQSFLGGAATGTTLRDAYLNDLDGGDAMIQLTSSDNSFKIVNPSSNGTGSGALFFIRDLSSQKSGLDISIRAGILNNSSGALRLATKGAAHILFGTGSTYNVSLSRTGSNVLSLSGALQIRQAPNSSFLTLKDSTNNTTVGFFSGTGDPNGVIRGGRASLYFATDTGKIWKNNNNGTQWVELMSGSGVLMAKMTRSTAQSIGAAAHTKISLNTTEIDVGGMANTTNSRIDIKKAGKYLVTAYWYSPNPGATTMTSIYKNGSRVMAGGGGSSTLPVATEVLDLVVGDYIEMYVYSSNAVNTDASSDLRPRLSVVQMDGAGASPFIDGGSFAYLNDTSDGLAIGAITIDTGVKLEVIGTASGRVLHAQDILRSSGSLIVDGNAYFNNYANCTALETVNGLLTCGTDAEGSGGSASGNVVPSRATMWHSESTKTAGTALTNFTNANQIYYTFTQQATPANGDAFTQGFMLKAGTYTFSVLGITNTNNGIIDWTVDGVAIVTGQDWYTSLGYNTVKTATVTIPTSGYHVLKGTVNGKHASSSSYAIALTKMWFSPTTDQSFLGGAATGTTLRDAYLNDLDGGDAMIQLTSSDNSFKIVNPASGGTGSGALFFLRDLSAQKSGLDISILAGPSTTGTGALRLATKGAAHILFGSGGVYDTALTRVSRGILNLSGALTLSRGVSASGNLLLEDSANGGSVMLKTGTGNPNGSVSGNRASLYFATDTGTIWKNENGGTVWSSLATGSGSVHMARMHRAAAQSITTATVTKIAFDGEAYDIGSIADYSTNDRFDIKKSGKYLVTASWSDATGLANGAIVSYIYKNGSLVRYDLARSSGYQVTATVVDTFDLVAGDYLEMYVYIDGGASTDTTTEARPTMTVMQIDNTAGASPFSDAGAFVLLNDTSDNLVLGATSIDSNVKLEVVGTMSGQVLRLSSGAVISRANRSEFIRLNDNTYNRNAGIYSGSGTPYNLVQASTGSLYLDNKRGFAYVNMGNLVGDSTGKKGWRMVQVGTGTGTTYPDRAVMWHQESISVAGSAMTSRTNSSQQYASFNRHTTPADGNAFTNGFYLRAGSYTFAALGATTNASAKVDWYIDGVLVETGQDWYTASTTYNVVKTDTVTITGDGYHILKGVVNTKNASSSNYHLELTKFYFYPAADTTHVAPGADYAEWFKASDSDLKSGELVCIDATKSSTVQRCRGSADPNVMGIVTTNPSFVGNDVTGGGWFSMFKEGLPVPGYTLVGLIGQIPAKVIVESGAVIRPGDSLTPALTPGYARRAEAGEPTVGVALEGLDGPEGTTGLISVLVARRNGSLTTEAVTDRVLQAVKDLRIEDEIELSLKEAVENFSASGTLMLPISEEVNRQVAALNIADLSSRLTTLSEQVAALSGALVDSQETATGSQIIASDPRVENPLSGSAARVSDLTASTLNVEDTLMVGGDARIAGDLALDGVLQVQSLFIPGIVTIDGALTASSVDTDHLSVSSGATIGGTLLIQGSLDLASGALLNFASGSTVDFGNLVVKNALHVLGPITIDGLAQFLGDVEISGELRVSNRHAGFARIGTGQTMVTVRFTHDLTLAPVVNVTPLSFVEGPWRITPATSTGFTIELKNPAAENYDFAWTAILANDPQMSASGSAVTDAENSIAFPVDAFGVPLSSNNVWNSCIRNLVTLDTDGNPLSCSRYHTDYVWTHPDLEITFTWNTQTTPPLLLLPDGYAATVQIPVITDGLSVPSDDAPADEVPVTTEEPATETPVEELPTEDTATTDTPAEEPEEISEAPAEPVTTSDAGEGSAQPEAAPASIEPVPESGQE